MADPRPPAADPAPAGTDPSVTTHCDHCGDRLVDGYTIRLTLDQPDDLDLDVHDFCCLAHAHTWLTHALDDPAYTDR